MVSALVGLCSGAGEQLHEQEELTQATPQLLHHRTEKIWVKLNF